MLSKLFKKAAIGLATATAVLASPATQQTQADIIPSIEVTGDINGVETDYFIATIASDIDNLSYKWTIAEFDTDAEFDSNPQSSIASYDIESQTMLSFFQNDTLVKSVTASAVQLSLIHI